MQHVAPASPPSPPLTHTANHYSPLPSTHNIPPLPPGALADFRFPIGAPVSGLRSFALTEQLGVGDKLANALALGTSPIVRALVDFDGGMNMVRELDDMTFTEWFMGKGGSRGSIDRMWDPIAYVEAPPLPPRLMATTMIHRHHHNQVPLGFRKLRLPTNTSTTFATLIITTTTTTTAGTRLVSSTATTSQRAACSRSSCSSLSALRPRYQQPTAHQLPTKRQPPLYHSTTDQPPTITDHH